MSTADLFALITAKKLLGFIDFDTYLMKYLRKGIRDATGRLFIQGSFGERMPLSSTGNDEVQVDLKPTLLDGMAHDGAGRLLDLQQISRAASFENVTGQTYEVGAQYIEYPIEIRINPRTGRPEFDHMAEGIGVQATPDSVQVDPGTLTFVVDSLFEQGTSPGNHTGRLVRVFNTIPGDGATTATIAIEVCTVFNDGNNKITTAGRLGQSAPASSPSAYAVQLIGITVLRDTATNRPSQLPKVAFYVGTVVGNGPSATPTAFDITAQKIIQAQSADLITVDPLPPWFDGTTNTEATVQAALADIISDLTSTTGEYGAGKISAKALPAWFDGSIIPADQIGYQLQRIVQDLAGATGDIPVYGATKIFAGGLEPWADSVSIADDSVNAILQNIVASLVSTTGARGAGKLTAPALGNWADGTANPADVLAVTIAKIVSDLSSFTGSGGAAKIGVGAVGAGDPMSFAGSFELFTTLTTIWSNLNQVERRRRSQNECSALWSLRKVYTNSSWTVTDIDCSINSLGSTAQLVAVGDGPTLLGRSSGDQWSVRTPADGFSAGLVAVVNGALGWAWVGNGGWIQTSADTFVWTTRKNTGNNFTDIAYKSTTTATYCAVGLGGYIWTSTNLTTWTQRTGAAGMSSDDYVAIEFAAGLFVVTSSQGHVMTSPDGITWTQRTSGTLTGTSPGYLQRQLSYNARFGFVALYNRNSGEIGQAHSLDGITWTISLSGNDIGLDEPNVKVLALERSVVYLTSHTSSSPYSLNAMVADSVLSRPGIAGAEQMVMDIGECWPQGCKDLNGTIFVVGRLNSGDGCIMSSEPYRCNTQIVS